MALETKPIELNTASPSFALPGVDGGLHKLEDYASKEVLVIGFTCNHCPYVQAYEERLIQLVDSFKGRSIAFICINPNDDRSHPEDSFEKMQERAKEKKFNFDYLRDDTQEIARAFNAACTPEFYVYDKERKLRYHGKLDDSPREPSTVKVPYLKNAIEDLLAGKSPRLEQTSAIGCSIKWKTN